MNTYNFTGEWDFQLDLARFSETFTFDYIGYAAQKSSTINVKIIDVRNDNYLPEIEQINAINFIIQNQENLIKVIFKTLSNELIPSYKEVIGENKDIFIPLKEITDLKNFLGIASISIFNRFKDDYAYILMNFNSFRCDPEHGINLVFHKDRFIGTHEDFKEAYEDLGLNYEDVLLEMSLENQKKFENKDYNFYDHGFNEYSLKPWKKKENRIYPYRLLQTDQPDKFIDFMAKKGNNLGYDLSSLLKIAEDKGFNEVAEYLKK
jgi:hypothetical protein